MNATSTWINIGLSSFILPIGGALIFALLIVGTVSHRRKSHIYRLVPSLFSSNSESLHLTQLYALARERGLKVQFDEFKFYLGQMVQDELLESSKKQNPEKHTDTLVSYRKSQRLIEAESGAVRTPTPTRWRERQET